MNAKASESPLGVYRSYLVQKKLAYQYSPSADKAVFFPRVVCPFTGSSQLEWRISEGRGEVYATTVVHPREGAPYNVALIGLNEGFRMMSRVEGIDPHSVKIGQKVQVHFVVEEGQPAPLPVFVPLEVQHG